MAAEKGNKYATKNKGKKHKATLVKEIMQNSLKDRNDIIDFKEDLLRLANELIDSAKTIQEKKAVFDSVSKYVFFEKHEDKPKEDKIIVTLGS